MWKSCTMDGLVAVEYIVRKQLYAVVLENIYHIHCAIWSMVVGEIHTPV